MAASTIFPVAMNLFQPKVNIMQEDPTGLLDEQSISSGVCYAVLINGRRAFVKLLRRIAPNCQGVVGPAKWIGECVAAGDDPGQEGKEVEVELCCIIGRAKRREMVEHAIRQGFDADKDIYEYLQSCGVEINIKTVASYKSQHHRGTLFIPKRSSHNTPIKGSQISEESAALTMEICRLARKVGGLKTLGQTVESLRQALESLS